MNLNHWWSVFLVGGLGGFSSHLVIFLAMIKVPKVEWPEFLEIEKLRIFYWLIVSLNVLVAGLIALVILGYADVGGFKALLIGFGWPLILQWGLQGLGSIKNKK